MEPVNINTLKKFEPLINVPDEQLQWLIDNSSMRLLENGDHLTNQGQPLKGPHFIIEGEVGFSIMQNGIRRDLGTSEIGEITGYLPYSRGFISPVDSQAIDKVQVLSFHTEKIREMIKDHFELTQALVHTMTDRVREYTAIQQQNEKMTALGKLSAGLAHELNNPASAIVRDAVILTEQLKQEPAAFKKAITIQMDEVQIDAVNAELLNLLEGKGLPQLTMKEKARQEDELAQWLDEHYVDNSYAVAESFADFSFGTGVLDKLAQHIPVDHYSSVFNWISNLLITAKIAQNIQEASRRISNLVNSVKVFTHMDGDNDKQYADIHTGIQNTLVMLDYKIKEGNIDLNEIYDKTLPEVRVFVGELNQVWINLIDNALDAMEKNKKGSLTIKTEKIRQFIQVSVIDDGDGIPDEIKSRIFDPFFTTKPIGKGTGMGLEAVRRIVDQHNGSIKVNSVPGKTEFIVCFPIN